MHIPDPAETRVMSHITHDPRGQALWNALSVKFDTTEVHEYLAYNLHSVYFDEENRKAALVFLVYDEYIPHEGPKLVVHERDVDNNPLDKYPNMIDDFGNVVENGDIQRRLYNLSDTEVATLALQLSTGINNFREAKRVWDQDHKDALDARNKMLEKEMATEDAKRKVQIDIAKSISEGYADAFSTNTKTSLLQKLVGK